ncbi:hypothetical protein [Spirosoma migulaei]
MLPQRISPRQWLTHFASPLWLPVLMLLLHTQTSQAQSEQTAQQNVEETESKRGYWRLKTQAASRSTLIQFFEPNGKLLYEEIMPEKWVKLSRKNQKQFDRILDHLLANQLVASQIKTELLPPTPVEPIAPKVTVRSNTASYFESAITAYQVHAYINPTGKLYLIVNNPDQLRYKIRVADQKNRTVYEEFTNHNQYRRRLDLSALPSDAYQVIVQIDNKPFIYTIKRQDARFAYSIQPSTGVSRKDTVEQNRTDTSPSIVPMTINF